MIELIEPHKARPVRLMGFEREGRVDMILANPKGPDLEGYLARRFNEDV